MKKQSVDSFAAYGKDISHLIQAVEANKNKFVCLPRGPLGSYITVKKKKWSLAIENFIGHRLLQAFCVDNNRDRDVLVDLMNHMCLTEKPMILTTKFLKAVHDVKKNLVHVPDGCKSLFACITVNDTVVMNCLIDRKGIESVLLIPTEEQAYGFMLHARNVPINCQLGITLRGDQYFYDPNCKLYSASIKVARYLQPDIAAFIKERKLRLKECKRNLQELEVEFGEYEKVIVDTQKTLSENENTFERCKLGTTILNKKLQSLRINVIPYGDDLEELVSF